MKLLYFDRNDVSEGIDVNKTSESKECDISYYWCFWNKVLSFKLMYLTDAMIS